MAAAQSIAADVQSSVPDDTDSPEAPAQGIGFVAAHGGGAGATAWAAILDGADHGQVMPHVGVSVVLVARASLHGIEAAKRRRSPWPARLRRRSDRPCRAGTGTADDPERTQSPGRRRASDTCPVGVRAADQALWLADFTDVPAKDLARVRAALSTIKGETK